MFKKIYLMSFLICIISIFPITVSAVSVSAIAGGGHHTVALKTDGTVWTWGYNNYGQIGDGTTTNKTTPIQVSGLIGVSAIAGGGYHTIVLKTDGTIWTWGYNNYGQLGDNTTTNRFTPVQVSGLTGISSIAGGYEHTIALKSDGTVWTWGYNAYGQLGNGLTTNSTTPVQVSGLTGVSAIAAGVYHTVALKTDGTVWTWGYNYYGQLGNGLTTNSTTPVQVSSLTEISSIAAGEYHTVALKTDGTVWTWGHNGYGQLGDGTTKNKTTPVQVSSLTGVSAIPGGGYHTIVLKTDRTVWAWGDNTYGELGDGTTTNKTTPIQVSNLTGVSATATGWTHTIALKTDGAVWAWGHNAYGQLGDGTIKNKTTPVQVSGLGGGSNTAPIVTNITTSGSSGDITVTYNLTDADNDSCSITVQYQGGSVGTTWTTATTSGTTSGINPGTGETIIWKSGTDQAGQSASDYKIKIIPSDGKTTGTAGESSAFSVDNRVISKTYPIIVVPGILGSFHSLMKLQKEAVPDDLRKEIEFFKIGSLDPYGFLWTTLTDSNKGGYVKDITAFRGCYDWRQSIRYSAEHYLKPAIEEALQKSGADKVDIIAHSMGGVVARYYIQKLSGSDKVRKFIMIGTPNSGSAKTYYIWGGYSGPIGIPGDFLFSLYVDNFIKTCYDNSYLNKLSTNIPTLLQFIHDYFNGTGNLMPTYNFLVKEGVLVDRSALHEINRNDMLYDLNQDTAGIDLLKKNITTIIYYGDKKKTPKNVIVSNPSWLDNLLAWWVDGKPTSYESVTEGDDTVLSSSAYTDLFGISGIQQYNKGEISHLKLPTECATDIVRILTGKVLSAETEILESKASATEINSMIAFSSTNETDMLIQDSQNRKTGYENSVLLTEIPNSDVFGNIGEGQLITIENPSFDIYTVKISSTKNGLAGISISYSDQTVIDKEATEINIGQLPVSFKVSVTNTSDPITISPTETDTIPPNMIKDIMVTSTNENSATLKWTSPGSDGTTGSASLYDIRYSSSSITESNWALATQCSGEPTPQTSGSAETFIVTGLSSGTAYYFAIKATDNQNNTSLISNSVNGTTLADTTPPSNPTNFTASAGDSKITLGWTNPTADFSGVKLLRKTGGYPSGYNDTSATPLYTGTLQSYEDTGLTNGTTYYYKLYSYDGVPNYSSGISASAAPQASTGDGGGSSGGGGGGGCFIATVAYGTPMAEEVRTLCEFRDKHLLTNKIGKEFVGFYYKYGPYAADWIKDKECIKKATRCILKPIVLMAKGK